MISSLNLAHLHTPADLPNWRHRMAVIAIALPVYCILLGGFLQLLLHSHHAVTDDSRPAIPLKVRLVAPPQPSGSAQPRVFGAATPARPSIATPVRAPSNSVSVARAPSAHLIQATEKIEAKAVEDAPVAQTAAPSSASTASDDHAGSRKGTIGGGDMSARVIANVMPELPESLRDKPLEATVVVRFAIAADGNATATLIQATPDPRINQWLLGVFKHWRFFPALRDNAPVASTLEIRQPVSVQ